MSLFRNQGSGVIYHLWLLWRYYTCHLHIRSLLTVMRSQAEKVETSYGQNRSNIYQLLPTLIEILLPSLVIRHLLKREVLKVIYTTIRGPRLEVL